MFFTCLHTEIMQHIKNQDFLCLKTVIQPFIMRQGVVYSFFRRKRRSHTFNL